MSLRERAERDLGAILNNRTSGFGWPITLTDPAGVEYPDLTGFSNDISQVVDPDTGQLVSGRQASAAIRISDLTAAGVPELPRNIPEHTAKPWLVEFTDINGTAHVFKVRQSNPDRALGMTSLILEAYGV